MPNKTRKVIMFMFWYCFQGVYHRKSLGLKSLMVGICVPPYFNQLLNLGFGFLNIAIWLCLLKAWSYLTLTTQASVFVLCLQQLLPLFTTSQIQKIFFHSKCKHYCHTPCQFSMFIHIIDDRHDEIFDELFNMLKHEKRTDEWFFGDQLNSSPIKLVVCKGIESA